MRILGVCAGNGVILYPLKKRGEIVGNVEPRQIFYTPNDAQWNLNFKGVPMRKSLKEIKAKDIDVIVGHPDCGSGSVLRLSRAKKTVKYSTNPSLATFFESIEVCQPKLWLLENLIAFGKEYPKPKLREIFPNYRFVYLEGSVAHWGNSQMSRKRLVIVGIRRDLPKSYMDLFPLPKIKTEKLSWAGKFELPTFEQPEIGHFREPDDKTCNLILGDRTIITYGEARQVWMERLGDSRWRVGGKMNNQPGVTRNIATKYPTTMRKQNRQFSRYGYVLSPREMANIQGVPLEFELYWDRIESKRIYWLNKLRATVTKCPPYEIGKWFSIKLKRIKNKRSWKILK